MRTVLCSSGKTCVESNIKIYSEVTGPLYNNIEIIALEQPACPRSTEQLGVPSPPGPLAVPHSPAPSHEAPCGNFMTRGCLYNRGQFHCGACMCLAFILLEVFAAIQAGNCTTPFQNRLLLELLSFYYCSSSGREEGKVAGQPGRHDGWVSSNCLSPAVE